MTNDFQSAIDSLVSIGSADDPAARPVILRVLVDLFVFRPYHAPSEVAQFEEIVSRLIEKADPDSCALIAAKLASHECAPPELLAKLARMSIDAAVSVMGSASVVSPARLAAAAAWGPPEVASAVAGRADLDAALVATLAMRPERDVTLALARNADAALARAELRGLVARAREDAELARALLARADGADCAPLYLHAGAEQRAAILAAAYRAALANPLAARMTLRLGVRLDADDMMRFEQAALSQDRARVAGLLAEFMSMAAATSTRIVEDEGGEPLALTLAALALPEELLERLLIFLVPGDGRSLQRYDRLRALAIGLPTSVALQLVESFAGPPVSTPPAPHRPTLDDAPGAPSRAPARATRPAAKPQRARRA